MATIQKHIVKRGKRVALRRFIFSKENEKLIATWRLDLDEICRVFDVRSFTSV